MGVGVLPQDVRGDLRQQVDPLATLQAAGEQDRDRLALAGQPEALDDVDPLVPVEQREILTLHRFQNLRQDEIARLLDCNVGAVKVRVHRALGALRDRFFRLRKERTV